MMSSAPPSLLAGCAEEGPLFARVYGCHHLRTHTPGGCVGWQHSNRTYVKSVNKKTGKKIFHSGVCATEYQERVLPVFAADGFELFCRKHSRAWLLQQDGAAIHQTAASIELATR